MSKNLSNGERENPIKTAFGLLLIALIFILVLPFLIPGFIRSIYLRIRFHLAAYHQGRFILLIYSDSPNWKTYIEQNIIPHIQDHAIILNWSERSRWDKRSWAVQAFHHWGGQKEFNPMAIVFGNLAQVQVIRFYKAFQEYKHGRMSKLQKVEAQLFQLVEEKTGKKILQNAP